MCVSLLEEPMGGAQRGCTQGGGTATKWETAPTYVLIPQHGPKASFTEWTKVFWLTGKLTHFILCSTSN